MWLYNDICSYSCAAVDKISTVYRIFGVCDKDNVSSLRTLLGLHGVSELVRGRRARFMDGLLDTGSAALMHAHYINCLV